MERIRQPVREAVFEAAEHLFAELGYDQTSVELITDAAGVPTEAVAREFGGKKALYLAVMENVREQGQRTLNKLVENFTPDAAGVHYLIDCTLDHSLQRPQDAGLWMQRRMRDAADFVQVEQESASPQFARTLELTKSALRPELDAGLVLQEIFWSVHTFVRGGILDETGGVLGPEDPAAVERFRRHLHQMASLYVGEDC